MTQCKYKEIDTRLKRQFINGTNNHTMTAEIIKELIIIKDTSESVIPGQNNKSAVFTKDHT